MPKTSALRIRIEPELHKDFLETCRRLDIPAAQVLRQYIRRFVEQHDSSNQEELFMGQAAKNQGEKDE